MQVKFLSIALTTALAAALTGCGGDNDNNYNKDQYVPIPGGASSAQIDALQKQIEALKNSSATDKSQLNALQEKLNQICSANPKACGSTSGNASGGTSGNTSGGTSGNTSGGTSGNTSGGTSGNTSGGTSGNTSPAQPVAPVVDPVNNTGNAANTDKTVADANVVGFQNYDRGLNARFDTVLNKNAADTGSATVVNHNKLDNHVLSNIVVARTGAERTRKTIYTGEYSNEVDDFHFNSQTGELDLEDAAGRTALQYHNSSLVEYNQNGNKRKKTVDELKQSNGESVSVKDIFKGDTTYPEAKKHGLLAGDANDKTVADAPYQLQRDYVAVAGKTTLKEIVGDPNKTLAEDIDYKTATGLDKEKDSLSTFSLAVNKAGLVRMLSENGGNQTSGEHLGEKVTDKKRFVIRGQERAITKRSGDKYEVLHRTGVEAPGKLNGYNKDNSVRIFGSLSQTENGWDSSSGNGSFGDIPEQIWDKGSNKFVTNPNYDDNFNSKKVFKMSEGTPNSYQLTAESANADIKKLKAVPETEIKKVFIGDDGNEGRNRAMYRAGLTAKPIHLNHVQYGRVTVDASNDKVKKIVSQLKGDKDRAHIALATKFAPKHGEAVKVADKRDTTVDLYFARGLQDTSAKEMPKQGTVTYLGHALAYGLDNSLHTKVAGDDNTVKSPVREGVGNFVRADVDFANKTVKGSVYNIWLDAQNPQAGVVEDKLVDLTGNITPEHNSVIGDATLTYGTKEQGSFKGAFYGKGAAELGGQFNSVKEGYGPAKWGGVFGTKKVGVDKDVDITFNTEEKE